jgi:hypothetical protein
VSYIDPKSVVAPKQIVSDVEVIYDAGPIEGSWAVARLKWMGRDSVGVRWNGNPEDKTIGTPQARGIPTWFIVPEELEHDVLARAERLARGDFAELQARYSEMAQDTEREREAEEWSEGLMKDQTRV